MVRTSLIAEVVQLDQRRIDVLVAQRLALSATFFLAVSQPLQPLIALGAREDHSCHRHLEVRDERDARSRTGDLCTSLLVTIPSMEVPRTSSLRSLH